MNNLKQMYKEIGGRPQYFEKSYERKDFLKICVHYLYMKSIENDLSIIDKTIKRLNEGVDLHKDLVNDWINLLESIREDPSKTQKLIEKSDKMQELRSCSPFDFFIDIPEDSIFRNNIVDDVLKIPNKKKKLKYSV